VSVLTTNHVIFDVFFVSFSSVLPTASSSFIILNIYRVIEVVGLALIVGFIFFEVGARTTNRAMRESVSLLFFSVTLVCIACLLCCVLLYCYVLLCIAMHCNVIAQECSCDIITCCLVCVRVIMRTQFSHSRLVSTSSHSFSFSLPLQWTFTRMYVAVNSYTGFRNRVCLAGGCVGKNAGAAIVARICVDMTVETAWPFIYTYVFATDLLIFDVILRYYFAFVIQCTSRHLCNSVSVMQSHRLPRRASHRSPRHLAAARTLPR
jgi:hypothetical protein